MESNTSLNLSEIVKVDNDNLGVPEWAKSLVILFMSIVTVFGVTGNGIVIIVQLKNRDKSSTDVLVSTMAAFELVCSGFNGSLILLMNLPALWREIASGVLCSINSYTLYATSISSTLLLTAIALDRFYRTCKPLSPFYSKRRAHQICTGVVAASFIVSIPGYFTPTLNEPRMACERKDNFVICHVLDLSLTVAYFTMFIVVVICYTKVAIYIQKRHRQKAQTIFAQANTPGPSNKHLNQPSTHTRKLGMFFSKNKIHPRIDNVNQTNISVIENLEEGNTAENSLKRDHIGKKPQQFEQHDQTGIQIHREKGKLVNRISLIMFLITTIYTASWAVHWLTFAIASSETIEGHVAVYLTKHLFMINCVTNPLFFITLSSKFREKAKKFLGGVKCLNC